MKETSDLERQQDAQAASEEIRRLGEEKDAGWRERANKALIDARELKSTMQASAAAMTERLRLEKMRSGADRAAKHEKKAVEEAIKRVHADLAMNAVAELEEEQRAEERGSTFYETSASTRWQRFKKWISGKK